MAQASAVRKIMYINLDRRPDRKAHIERQFEGDARLERIRAVDGFLERDRILAAGRGLFTNPDVVAALDYYERDPACAGPEPAYCCYDTGIHFATMGNSLSHMEAWRRTSELDGDDDRTCSVVMQDDTVVCPGFLAAVDDVIADMPEDAALVWLGRHVCAVGGAFVPIRFDEEPDVDALFAQRVTRLVGRLNDSSNPCSLAYVLTRKGARFLLAHTPEITRPTDWHMNHMLLVNNIHYATYKALATSSTENFRSDIFDAVAPPTSDSAE
jgi:GR25 family glycosyltransferase involved in LPS biosynthesis